MTADSFATTQADLLRVFEDLDAMHGWRGWHWWPDADPFEVIVGAILVQNTMWSNVERALDLLRAASALSPAAMSALGDAELETLIRPSGQYRQKARKLRALLHLIDAHGSLERLLALPAADLRPALLATWGIGPETADVIVLYASRGLAWSIDAYTIRLFGRLHLGPVHTTAYDAWQRFFVEALPRDRDLWARFRALIVMHCKHTCRKHLPKCQECLLLPRCPGSPANLPPAAPRG
jgi:endonuclease III related protein